MKHFIKNRLALLIALLPLSAYAQNNLKDLKKISEAYVQHPAYQFELKYSAFNDYQTPVEAETKKMNVFADGHNYYCKQEDNEILINEQYQVIIDHENKLFVIDAHHDAKEGRKELMAKLGLDSIMKKLNEQVELDAPKVSVEQKRISDTERQYVFNYSDGEFTSIKLNYDHSTFLISKLILYYREKMETTEGQPQTTPRVEISYLDTDLAPHFDKQLFSEKKYALVKKNGQLELSAALKNYKVINHLLK
jgi:hypothetical protein